MARSAKIAGFLGSTRRARRFAGLLASLVNPALTVLLLLLLLGLLPAKWLGLDLRPVLVIAGLLWCLVTLVVASRRQRDLLVQLDHELGLRDGLVTWSALGPTERGDAPMFDWLEQDLEGRIAKLPREQVAQVTKPRFGWARYLLPVILLLLLLQQFAPLPPRLPAPRGPAIGIGGGGATPGGGSGRERQDQRPPPPARPDPEPPPQAPPRADPPEDPPKPLLQLPPADEIVLPEFVGDGPTRRELAPLFELAPSARPSGAGAAARDATPPAPGTPEFTRAHEQALRSRHVPDEERPFVRSYFERLARRGR